MDSRLKVVLMIIIGVVGYVVWGVMAYYDPSQRQNFLALNMGMVAGTVGLMLRDLAPTDSRPGTAVDPAVLASAFTAAIASVAGTTKSDTAAPVADPTAVQPKEQP